MSNTNNPYPSPVPPKMPTELEQFKAHFDFECGHYCQNMMTVEPPVLNLEIGSKTISLPLHAQLYDDFIEFLNQQISFENEIQ